MSAPDLTPDHPVVEMFSALESETMRVERVECAVAGMPASDHPVVQRAARVLEAAQSRSATTSAHLSILTALTHLTADDLRSTPAGRELMAETWQEGAMDHAAATSRMTPETRRIINELMKAANPYLERNA